MPRTQVYGKRSRAVYNSFAIFDSPQRPTTLKPTIAEERETQRLVEKVTNGLSLDEYAQGVADGRRRTALGERNANSVVKPILPKKARKPKTRKAAKLDEVENIAVEQSIPLEDAIAKGEEATCGPLPDLLPPSLDAVDQLDTPLLVHVDDHNGEEDVQEEQHEYGQKLADLVGDELKSAVSTETSEPLLEVTACLETLALGEDCISADTIVPGGSNVAVEATTLLEPSSPLVPDAYSQHCSQLLELSSHRLTRYDSWSDLLSNHFSLAKIAEASFGEVYRLSLLEQLPGLTTSDESVFKVIALQPPASALPTAKKARAAALKKAEAMSKPDDVANEVKLLQRMSSIPGFTNFRDVRILQGRPPPLFVDAFKRYNVEQKAKRREASHFPDPGKKASYSEDQLWAVIEMQDAGTDLERVVEERQCTSVWSVWDVFWQVVLSLAKGEEGAQFEHRDLHLGNICVRQRSLPAESGDRSINVKKKLGFTNLETTIIDYTISRCLLSSPTGRKQDQEVAYHDLSLDPYLFEGDSTEEYQYDIYRYMRGAVYHADPMSNDPDPPAKPKHHRKPVVPWRDYTPIANLVWLHYLLHQLLEQLEWPSARKAPAKKAKAGAAHAVWKRANDLEHELLKVQTLLDPETGLCRNGLRSATDVVGLALTEGWLDVADVVGANGADEAETEVESATGGEQLAQDMTHLVINIDTMEEQGLEAAEQEARSRSRRTGLTRKA